MLSEDRPAIDSPVSLTSEPDRFSDEAWELLLAGQDLARRWRHGELDVEHLMQVLFSDRRFAGSLRGLSLDADDLLDQLEGFLAEQPMARSEDLFIGEDLEQLLEAAEPGARPVGIPPDRAVPPVDRHGGEHPAIGAVMLASAGLSADRL
jgi:ATPases with chaperone activity, ATP-binding subunit